MNGPISSWWDLWRQRRAGGGGGKQIGRRPYIHVGGSSPRGRRFPRVAYSKPPRSVIIKSKFVQVSKHSGRRLNIWLDYCSKNKEREQGRDDREQTPVLRDREFFSENRNGISKEEATAIIKDNFGKVVAYHQMILSPGDREVDPYDYARKQVSALEEKLGHKVTWIANVHRDTGPDKTHINLTIAGSIPNEERQRLQFPETEQQRSQERLEPYVGDGDARPQREQLERQFESEVDRQAHELTKGEEYSPQGVRYTKEANRAADYVEWRNRQAHIKNIWNKRGDVYIDRDSLDAMRSQGNYDVHIQRNFERELERAIERELGDRTLERDRSREQDIESNSSSERHKDHDAGKEEFKQNMPGIMPDDSNNRDSDDEEHRRERERDDDDDGFRRR